MKKTINKEVINGRIYEHNLAVKTVQNKDSENFGKEFINGTIDVATDDECLNVITVNFTYVTETTKAGAKNATYAALKTIIDSGKTIVANGPTEATMVRINTALGLNDFYTNRNGDEVLVSVKRNDGGFVTIVNKLDDPSTRNKFECDMLITGTRIVEADEEKHIAEDYLVVKGAVFNFRNALLPVEFIVKGAGGIKYFESLEASSTNPVFTKVWGNIECQTIIDKREEETAFGEPSIKEYTRTIREWVITGCAKEPYEIGDSQTGITIDEVKQAAAERETYLADVKRRQDEYNASKNAVAPATAPTNAGAAAGGFNF